MHLRVDSSDSDYSSSVDSEDDACIREIYQALNSKNTLHNEKSSRSNQTNYIGALCFDFLRGQCPRGASCQFVHQPNINMNTYVHSPPLSPSVPTTKSVKTIRPICFKFQQGECRRGDTCSLHHSLSQSKSSARVVKGAVCFAFLDGQCEKGDACQLLHDDGVRVLYAKHQHQQQQLLQQQEQQTAKLHETELEDVSAFNEDEKTKRVCEDEEEGRAFFISASQQGSDDSFFDNHKP
jgi:hypothetical protein